LRSPRPRLALLALPASALVVALTFLVGSGTAAPPPVLDRGNGHAHLPNGKLLPHPSGGTEVAFDEERQEASDAQSGGFSDTPPDATASAIGCANRGSATNPRVNQDCTLRRQAEEQVVVNPLDADNVIAGQNDSRIGFNHCGFDYSLDGGETWGDGIPPFFQLLSPIGHTYDAASDPAVAVDGNGKAWFSCVVFDVNSNASGLVAVPSTAGLKGAAYSNIASSGSPFVVAQDASGAHFYDKEFIAADRRAGHSEVYVTFTDFQASNTCKKKGNSSGICQSPISISKWTGTAWTTPVEISGAGSFCQFGNTFNAKLSPNACNFDQGSFPVVLPNGDVYVVFNNGNTPSTINQQLGVYVHVNGNTLTPNPPVKVGVDDFTNAALCDFGRGPEECVDSLNIRTNDFPALAVDPNDGTHLVAVWQDARTAPSNNKGKYDIVVSESQNGGQTWSDSAGTSTPVFVTPGAYFEPSVAMDGAGHVVVSTYRANTAQHTSAIGDGTFGYGYFFFAGGSGTYAPASDAQNYPSPQANAAQTGFLGDYSSITAAPGGNVFYMVWSDTRNASSAGPDEDVFVYKLDLS
jgi:hypothetical protein